MAGHGASCSWMLASCIFGLGLRAACNTFVVGCSKGIAAWSAEALPLQRASVQTADFVSDKAAASDAAEAPQWHGMARFFSGVALGVLLLASAAPPAWADLDDVAIPVDGKGKTVNLTREEILRGKRLFNAACATCHVGGGTRTNQNVGLGYEELSGAQPTRNTVEGLVDYLNSPTTYDGLKDISEVHPSIRGADLWPKMR
eukprot:CAMPEP_0179045274 /NCGR_PEP_ID=MMETSP0796-20121207/18094_1 /TAXON_ID=73915 /ORGANISM="Pyrodinium bahamense, Strain pbaha01" /LENGTH=200 /DNA_ID=CAMNT_0020741677 /DNA_START=45 /DNA_END=644 /DNA_ORIENTATION=+